MFRSTISNQDRDLVFMVRELVENNIAPKAVDYDSRDSDNFDWSAVDLLAHHNLIAPTIPKEYGGRGLSHLTTAMILEEIAAGCAGVATCVATNLHAISPLYTNGTEAQRQEFLPPLTAKKAKLGSLAMVENLPNLDIIAHREHFDIKDSSVSGKAGQEDAIYLNGFKEYVINAQGASFVAIMFSCNKAESAKRGMQVAVLPMSTSGIKVTKQRKLLGLRYASSSELIFDNVLVDPQYLIGQPGSGFLVFMQNLERCAPYVGAVALGISRAAFELALSASKNRFINGRPSFEESAIRFALSDMAIKLNAARLSVHLACWLLDNDMDCSEASSKCKILSSSVSREITNAAMEIIGGRAYLRGYEAEIYLRDAKMLSLFDGSEQFHKHLLAAQY